MNFHEHFWLIVLSELLNQSNELVNWNGQLEMIHGNELILPALPQSDSEIDRQSVF